MQLRPRALLPSMLVAFLASPAVAAELEVLSQIAIDNPAFLHVQPGLQPGSSDLVVSSFAFFGANTVSRINIAEDGPAGSVTASSAKVVTDKVAWPNNVTSVPAAVFGKGYVTIAAGFLTPGYTTGTIAVANLETGEEFSLSKPKSDYFYHRALWVDMNGDGRLDVLTARAKKPMWGDSDGELVWFEQPRDHSKGFWKEHVLAKGPDTYFVVADLNHDGSKQIIAAEFFGAALTLLWEEGGVWQRRVLDDTIGAMFDLSLVDLNNDGKLDLLVTNHTNDDKAGIYAYEIPTDFKNAAWTRHTLLSGIVTKTQGVNQAAPGSALAWQVSAQQKPYIVAAGDGSGQVHLLKPLSQSADDWTYEASTALDTESTIGQIALGSPLRDGSTPLYVPAYDIKKIFVLKMVP